MLPIVLVLLVASSAFAAPSVSISQYGINEVAPARDNGKLVSSFVTDRVFELVDGGDMNIYILTVQQIMNDLANQPDSKSQALAVAQTVATLGELANGIPGDSCAAATTIDAYAGSRSPQACRSYLIHLAQSIDTIAQAAANPNAYRYQAGPRSNCAANGRSYQFEAAWDAILDQATPYTIGLVNEEYCAAKRLYTAFNVRSNNVGAAITAASLPPVNSAVQKALGPIAEFLRVVISGADARQYAAAAKSALLN